MSDVRDRIEAAMPEHQPWCQAIAHVDCCGQSDCDCGVGEALDRLRPTVDALIRAGAADALDQAAAARWSEGGGWPTDWLRDRAKHLRAATRRQDGAQ